MNLRPRSRHQADINLTPLIDVVFLLLIFFMVSTTFKDESRLRVQLPNAQGEAVPAQEPDIIRILIDREGVFEINNETLPESGTGALAQRLSNVLATMQGQRSERSVLIQADAQTSHQAVMTALDAARRAGLTRVAFATVHLEDSAP